MRTLRGFATGVAWLVLAACESTPVQDSPQQLVVVTTKTWTAVEATLRRFERGAAAAPWREVGTPMTAVVGTIGLGWGRGEHAPPDDRPENGPKKREGDGRAPAGIYALTGAFGSVEPARVPFVRMPYQQMTKDTVCVDDTSSRYYNKVFPGTSVPIQDWKSAERMLRLDSLYALGLVIGHNAAGVPGEGSCIFLHSWVGPGVGTAGCTAVSATDLELLLRWLDPRHSPRVVQVPAEALDLLRAKWPDLTL